MTAHQLSVQSDPLQPMPAKASRRTFLRNVGLALGGIFVSGCVAAIERPAVVTSNRRERNADPDREITQLVYQDWRSDWFPAMVEEMLDIFHQQHPSIRVFFTPDPPNLIESMSASMMAGTAPDLFQGCCTFFPIWAQSGYTTDLQPWVEQHLDESVVAEWDTAQYQAMTLPTGHRFGLPKYHGSLALYYNKDLFDQFGFDYPNGRWNHDDYAEAMRALTQDRSNNDLTDLWGSMMDVSWDRVQIHANGWGGHLIAPERPNHCALSEPKTLDAFEWLRARMWDEKCMATRLDVQNMSTRSAFINQRVAMVEDGSWALKEILNEANFRIGVVPFPAGPERQVTLGTTDGFGIYSETLYADAAWTLMNFLIGKTYGQAMMKANFLQPARRTLVDEWIDIIGQEFPNKAREIDLAAFAEGHRKGYSVTIEIGPNMEALQQHTYEQWEQIFTFGTAPVSSMRSVCQQMSSIRGEKSEGGAIQ
ncbi:MAG: extracellular solute-binding protein [Chloroflexota bacterium]